MEKWANLAGGKTDATLAVDGTELKRQHSETHHRNASPPSGNWSQPLRTETISRFHFFILTLPPCGCCTAGVKLYSEVFQREEKVFFVMHRRERHGKFSSSVTGGDQ